MGPFSESLYLALCNASEILIICINSTYHHKKFFIINGGTVSTICYPYTAIKRYHTVPVMLDYSRSIKPMAESTAEVQISFYGIQVCSYLLPICHWTWHYTTIVNS